MIDNNFLWHFLLSAQWTWYHLLSSSGHAVNSKSLFKIIGCSSTVFLLIFLILTTFFGFVISVYLHFPNLQCCASIVSRIMRSCASPLLIVFVYSLTSTNTRLSVYLMLRNRQNMKQIKNI